ncbi:hypothetical protein RB620_09335 [Paenibacillus sp. LHD-117]|uniref:hypothetical protein n=1 Tax=Paenibacillus sp. LHD-117 TaxID=3071412 RepID=UPI0027E1FF37|nr:hypothetical protein [Paenibacillus sp. LHD-117]MDQ6419633.1 hypothetical protein [Paenibacillus sp. LHD-117]
MAALRLSNASGWLITKSYAKTWDNYGVETGYVDEFGQHSPSDSLVTKRFEDAGGVVFNVIDSWYAAHLPVYETYKGRCSMYFKKTSPTASTTKAFLDFHHNWKTYVWNASAEFSNIGLTGVSYQLTVTYSAANKNFQRSSGGRTAN